MATVWELVVGAQVVGAKTISFPCTILVRGGGGFSFGGRVWWPCLPTASLVAIGGCRVPGRSAMLETRTVFTLGALVG